MAGTRLLQIHRAMAAKSAGQSAPNAKRKVSSEDSEEELSADDAKRLLRDLRKQLQEQGAHEERLDARLAAARLEHAREQKAEADYRACLAKTEATCKLPQGAIERQQRHDGEQAARDALSARAFACLPKGMLAAMRLTLTDEQIADAIIEQRGR